MSTIKSILSAYDVTAAQAAFALVHSKRGLSGRNFNRACRALKRAKALIAARKRSEAAAKGAATRKAKAAAALVTPVELTPVPVTVSKRKARKAAEVIAAA